MKTKPRQINIFFIKKKKIEFDYTIFFFFLESLLRYDEILLLYRCRPKISCFCGASCRTKSSLFQYSGSSTSAKLIALIETYQYSMALTWTIPWRVRHPWNSLADNGCLLPFRKYWRYPCVLNVNFKTFIKHFAFVLCI